MHVDPRYKTVPSPPSRSEQCHETIKHILQYADENALDKDRFIERVVGELGIHHNVTSSQDIRSLINFFTRNGILVNSNLEVEPNQQLLNSQSAPGNFGKLFIERISKETIGFYDILFELYSADLLIEDLYNIIISRYNVEWDSKRQVKNRVDWLRGLGFVSKPQDSRHYRLTELGEKYVVNKCDKTVVHPRRVVEHFKTYAIDAVDTETPLSPPLVNGQLTKSQPIDINVSGLNNRDEFSRHLILLYAEGAFYGYGELKSGSDSNRIYYRYFEETVGGGSVSEIENAQKRAAHIVYNGSQTFKNAFDYSDYQPFGELELDQPKSRKQITLPSEDGYSKPPWLKELTSITVDQANNNSKEERIELQRGIPNVETHRTFSDWTPNVSPFDQDLSSLEVDTTGLFFPNEEELVKQISSALAAGDHVVLIGPPGTGKSALARRITEAFVDNQYEMVTATADWSTFNTIGGYQVKQDNYLQFQPGVFLQRFQDVNHEPKLEWLIIDELNRADIDKAFGSLFSAIVGDSIQTPFTDDEGNIVEILGPSDSNVQIADHRYYIPEDWRLITTMNTYDKTSLYEMSYAFMRRFAFIHVEPPREAAIDDDLIESYANEWNLEVEDLSEPLAAVWKAIQPTRQLGPAVFERVLQYVSTHPDDDLTEPVMMYILPQLEGLASTRQIELVESILDEEQAKPYLNDNQLVRFAADYFGVDPDRFEG